MDDDRAADAGYEPPMIRVAGNVADLTRQKEVNAADGETFLGIDIGSV
jgi:hypothetical protein